MTHAFRHSRPTPPEWVDLTAYAESIIPADMPTGQSVRWRQASQLARHVRTLPNEPLEANYYYGLGEVMCGMARLLDDPPIRERVIGGMAIGLVSHALQVRRPTIPLDRPFVPLIRDLRAQAMEGPFYAVSLAAWRQMPAPERVLVNALAAVVSYRRANPNRPRFIPGFVVRLLEVHDIRRSQSAVQSIAHNSLTGATGVLKTLLSGSHPAAPTAPELLAKPIHPAALQRIRHAKEHVNTARLRLDEAEVGVGWEGSGDTLHIDTTVFKTPPAPVRVDTGAEVFHEARLGCPAIQAGGLLRDVTRNILPAAIATAAQIVPGEVLGMYKRR